MTSCVQLSQELDSEEDSGSNTSRELCYETPPTGTPPSSTHSPMHGVSASTGVHLHQGCGSVAVKREGGERVRAKVNRGVRLQRGKYLGKENVIKWFVHLHNFIILYTWNFHWIKNCKAQLPLYIYFWNNSTMRAGGIHVYLVKFFSPGEIFHMYRVYNLVPIHYMPFSPVIDRCMRA